MITYPLVRAVTAPHVDADVLYNFCDSDSPGVETYVQREGFSIGVPELLGDADGVGVDWSLRQLTVPQVVEGPKNAALARQSQLARVLMRQRVWLMVQLDANTAPVWWHAYRSQPGEVSFDSVYVDDHDAIVPPGTAGAEPLPDMWQIGVTINAKSFGYLERVTLPAVTIGSDPGVSSPLAYRAALPAIPGDVPTYARIALTAEAPFQAAEWLFMVIHGTTAEPTFLELGDGDDWDAVDDFPGTTTTGTSGDYLGGSYRTITGVPTTLQPALNTSVPLPAGSQRVLVRLTRRNDEESTLRIGLTTRYNHTPQTIVESAQAIEVEAPLRRVPVWVDLGEVAAGTPLPADVTPSDVSVAFHLWLACTNPAAELRLDAVMVIPTSDGTVDSPVTVDSLTAGLVAAPVGSSTNHLDGDTGAAWITSSLGSTTGYLPTLTGGFPTLDPAQDNTLWVIPLSVTAGAYADTGRTATRQVEVSCHPRPLWLGDGQVVEDLT